MTMALQNAYVKTGIFNPVFDTIFIMKKVFLALLALTIGLALAFFSFLYGTVEPDYGPPTGSDSTCRSLALRPSDIKEITYSRGFPIQKTDTVMFDVVCGESSTYVPSPGEIARSWQFYANGILYSLIVFGIAAVIKKPKNN